MRYSATFQPTTAPAMTKLNLNILASKIAPIKPRIAGTAILSVELLNRPAFAAYITICLPRVTPPIKPETVKNNRTDLLPQNRKIIAIINSTIIEIIGSFKSNINKTPCALVRISITKTEQLGYNKVNYFWMGNAYGYKNKWFF